MSFAAQVITLYPDMFPGPLGHSLAGRALREGKWSLDAIQMRDFAADKHRSVDDTPAGGGAGMVLKPDILAAAVDHALERAPRQAPASAFRQRREQPAQAVGQAGESQQRSEPQPGEPQQPAAGPSHQ